MLFFLRICSNVSWFHVLRKSKQSLCFMSCSYFWFLRYLAFYNNFAYFCDFRAFIHEWPECASQTKVVQTNTRLVGLVSSNQDSIVPCLENIHFISITYVRKKNNFDFFTWKNDAFLLYFFYDRPSTLMSIFLPKKTLLFMKGVSSFVRILLHCFIK